MAQETKAGARNSASDTETLQSIKQSANGIVKSVDALLSTPQPVAIKAITDTAVHVAGYGVVFGNRDLVGDVFTSDTDFGFERSPVGMPVVYEHGMHPDLGKAKVGRVVSVETDDTGLFFEMELERSNKYIEDIVKLIEMGRVGLSTGALSHLVERDGNKNIISWPAGEMSLTLSPMAPETLGITTKETKQMENKAAYSVNGTLDMEPVEEEQAMEETATEEMGTETKRIEALESQIKAMKDIISTAPAVKRSAFIPGDTNSENGTSDYLKAFNAYLRGGPMPAAMKAMSTGSGSAGAFVPEAYSTEYARKLTLGSVLRKAGVKAMANPDGQPYNHPVVTTSSVSATPGDGIISENTSFTEREPTIANVQFTPYLYTARTQVSMMLMDDSRFDMMGVISDNNAAVFAGQENRDFFLGSGTGMPQGIMVAGTAVDTDSGTFQASDVKKLYYAMPEQYRIAGRCAWFANDTIIKEMDSWVSTTGPFIWQPSLSEGQPGMLMGFPVYGSPYMSSTMDEDDKVLAFVNLDYYMVVDFLSISLMRLNERYADQGAVGFIAYRRTDGRVLAAEAVRYLQMAA